MPVRRALFAGSLRYFIEFALLFSLRDCNLKTNVKFRPVTSANILSSPNNGLLEPVFAQNLPSFLVQKRKEEEDDPAYSESERNHAAPSECENQRKSVKVKAVP